MPSVEPASQIELLPKTSLCSFSAQKLASFSSFWINKSFEDNFDPRDFAYCLPVKNETGTLQLDRSQATLLSEHYGGEGVGSNFGGVRCGVLGKVQIKGIGQSPLVGIGNDDFHSFGGASILEGITEAIWGEICHMALPYGAARVYSVLDTGTLIPIKFPRTSGPTRTRRVLIQREPKLRPAHFMRSIFGTSADTCLNQKTDHNRVSNAIQTIDACLNHTLGTNNSVSEGLLKMCTRFAEQVSAARARRLMHGSLTPSNVGLDGSWLDFSSMTAVSDYGRIVVPRGGPDFLHEEDLMIRALNDLAFYIRKFNFCSKIEIDTRTLINTVKDQLSHSLFFDFIDLSGVPRNISKKIDPKIASRLYKCMLSIVASGSKLPFTILSKDNDVQPVMPEKMNDYHLSRIFRLLAYSTNRLEAATRLKIELPNDSIRCLLVDAYFDFIDHACKFSSNTLPFRTYCSINSILRNTETDWLYRTELYPIIERSICAEDAYQIIDYCIDRSKPILDRRSDEINFSSWTEGKILTLSPSSGPMLNFRKISFERFFLELDANKTPESVRVDFCSLWKSLSLTSLYIKETNPQHSTSLDA